MTADGPEAPDRGPDENDYEHPELVRIPSTPANASDPEVHPNSQLFGRGLLYVVVWSLQLVAGTLVSPILAYLLGPTEFGELASAIALHQVLTVLALVGIDQALVLQRAEDADDSRARGLVAFGTTLSMLITFLLGLTAFWWTEPLGFGEYDGLVLAVILWTAPGAAVQVMLALLISEDRLKPFALVSALSAVGGQIIGIALLLFVHNDATTYAWGGVVSQFAAMLIGLVLTRPRLHGLRDWSVARRAIQIGFPLALGGLASFVMNAGDRIIIQSMLGAAEVGRYQIAYTVGFVVVLLLSFTSSAWTPRFAQVRDDQERAALSMQSRDQLYRLLMPVTVGITLAAPMVLRLVAPSSFDQASLVVVVFVVALSAIPVAASGASGRLLITMRRGRTLAVIAGVAAVVNIAANFALIPWLGITGSAVATLLAYTLLAVLQRVALAPELGWHGPPTSLALTLGAVVLASAVTLLLPYTWFWNIILLIGALICLPWLFFQLRSARRPPGPTPVPSDPLTAS